MYGGLNMNTQTLLSLAPPDRANRRKEWTMSTTKPAPSFSSTPVGAAAAVDAASNRRQRGAGVEAARLGGVAGAGVGLTPPKWLPDENTLSCSGCGKDFDWIRRRVREDCYVSPPRPAGQLVGWNRESTYNIICRHRQDERRGVAQYISLLICRAG